MQKKILSRSTNIILNLSLFLTLGLFGAASFFPLESMWGINHLHFLPDIFKYFYWAVVIITAYIAIGPIPAQLVDRIFRKIDSLLWSEKIFSRILFITACTLIFYIFRVESYLLGDGYTLLANFGQGESYIHKWSQPGSIFLIRQIQNLLGGYTKETALLTFQILSVLSGALFITNMLSIVKRLFSTVQTRVLTLSTILFSGGILLFFGYVEFYAMSWAVTALFINLSLKSLSESRFIWWTVVAYLLTLMIHLQSIYFLPGLIYLVIQSLENIKIRKIGYVLFSISVVIGIILFVWLYNTKIEFEILILPFLQGRPVAPDFTVFSMTHLKELLNLTLLVLPGSIVLITLWILKSKKSFQNATTIFLTFLSIGSILFFVLFGAAITMGRDWDIMSLSLLAPLLLILNQIDNNKISFPSRFILNYIFVISFILISFLSVAIQTVPNENRTYTLLNNRNKNAWVVYANYFASKDNIKRRNEIMHEVDKRFPDYALLNKAYSFLEEGKYAKAMKLSLELVEKDPYQPDFHQILGNVYGKNKDFKKAEYHYLLSLKLHPYQPTLMNEIGQLYMKLGNYDKAKIMLLKAYKLAPVRTFITESLALVYIYKKQYDSALVFANILFLEDKNSPGGHLIEMTVALNKGNQSTARDHFIQYLKYGNMRSDYTSNSKYYQYLLEN